MVEILDSTLREGEQTRGVALTLEDKLDIARHLDAVGVEYVEAGHPAAAPHVREAVRAVAAEGLDAQVVAHARALRGDVDAARACDADWVGVFFSVADRRLEEHFRRNEAEAIALVTDAVAYAKDHGLKVRYTPEDTVRSDPERVLRVAQAAVDAGADRISVADTTGVMTPWRMRDFVARLVDALGPRVHAHCHNDLGMAVANSLAAVDGGAIVVDTCVNGLGERAGIADLAATATALTLTRRDAGAWDLTELPALAERVARASGVPVPPLAPVTGRNAFSHNAGLHVAAVLQHPGHYESIPAALVGRERHIVVDHLSGRDAVRHRLQGLGAHPTDDAVDAVLAMVKARGVNDATDGDLALLYVEATESVPGDATAAEAAAVTAAPQGVQR